ncbi:TIGR02147 family protein [Bdellovibrio sp. HCB274]|uniref:TIGR02147 family protein n=1 Tax=Bdellovibrio sp. HCB274 TaxID=3394361 RepID=UPI0039B412BD
MSEIITPSIYSFKDYKKYLQKWIESHPMKGRGIISAIAKSLRTQTSFLSQVLSGDLNFSSEQALDLSGYLKLNDAETEYLLAMVAYSRAGSANLRARLKKQVETMKELGMKERVVTYDAHELSPADQQVYYSAWYYAVIHIAATLTGLSTSKAIAHRLGLSEALVKNVLDFLLAKDLVRKNKDGHIVFGNKSLHLDWNSPLQIRHHSNFRMMTINSVEKGVLLEDLHYSSVVSLANEDYQNIRDTISKMIGEALKKIAASEPAEELACFSVDFFRIGKDD